jgi:hypothetical protein
MGMGLGASGQIDEISEEFEADPKWRESICRSFRGIHAHLVALVVEQCWFDAY